MGRKILGMLGVQQLLYGRHVARDPQLEGLQLLFECAGDPFDSTLHNQRHRPTQPAQHLACPEAGSVPSSGFTRAVKVSIKADEPKWLIDADPDLAVFHFLDDDPAETESKGFETEIGVTLPQLEEALPWMPRGTLFAIYRVDGIATELAQRLSGMIQDRQVLLLAGRFSPAGSVAAAQLNRLVLGYPRAAASRARLLRQNRMSTRENCPPRHRATTCYSIGCPRRGT